MKAGLVIAAMYLDRPKDFTSSHLINGTLAEINHNSPCGLRISLKEAF